MYSWANRIKFFFHSNILILVKWNGAIRKQFLLFCFVFFKINLNQILCKNGMEFCRNHWTENHLLLLTFFVDFSAKNQPQQEWNGIVRELLDRKADIAVAPMTINFARFVTLKYNVLYWKVVESILFFHNFHRVEIF